MHHMNYYRSFIFQYLWDRQPTPIIMAVEIIQQLIASVIGHCQMQCAQLLVLPKHIPFWRGWRLKHSCILVLKILFTWARWRWWHHLTGDLTSLLIFGLHVNRDDWPHHIWSLSVLLQQFHKPSWSCHVKLESASSHCWQHLCQLHEWLYCSISSVGVQDAKLWPPTSLDGNRLSRRKAITTMTAELELVLNQSAFLLFFHRSTAAFHFAHFAGVHVCRVWRRLHNPSAEQWVSWVHSTGLTRWPAFCRTPMVYEVC